ncbi:MAG: PilW family protein [Dokdonella sp.]|nr:PilW family protein [Dokdonella sp.]
MVALAIGSLLVLGLVQVFAASRAAYVTSEGMSRVQENARFAIDFLQRDIRMAGHFGCVNDQAHWVKGANDLDSHFGTTAADDPTSFNVSIHGYEATDTEPGQTLTIGSAATGWSPALPGVISALSPLPGSDIIELRYLDSEGVPVTNLAASGTATIVSFPAARRDSLTSDGVANPTMFGVADCGGVDVFPTSATNLAGGTVTSGNGIGFSARYTAQPSGQTLLYRAESAVYYVARNTAGVPALFRARFNGAAFVPEELVEGIESLQFLYGRDATVDISAATPPSGNITLQDTATDLANDANEWRRVGLVQVGVLARSPNPAASADPATAASRPRVLGVEFAPPATSDALYRGSYEVTVALRNRLFGN